MIKFRLVILLLLLSHISIGQGSRMWHEAHYFDSLSIDRSSFWGTFEYKMQSAVLTNQLLNEAVFDGIIENTTSAYLLDINSNGTSRLNAGVEGALWYRMKSAEGPALLFGFEMQDMLYGRITNGLAQLYLRGNGGFEDQTLPLGNSKLKYLSYQSLGFGMEWNKTNVSFGTNFNLIKASRFQSITIGDQAQLYTAPYGTRLEANLDFEYHSSSSKQPKTGAWYGTGGGVDLYLTIHPENSKSVLSIQASNLGMIHFGGSRSYSLSKDTVFSGIEVENILELEGALTSNSDLDSIEAILGLQQSEGSFSTTLPMAIQLDYVRSIGERVSFAFQLRQIIAFGLPQARVGIAFQPRSWLAIEPYLRAGGFTMLDLGLTVTTNFKDAVRLFVKYELFESQFAPETTTGQAFLVGGQILF